MRFGMGGTAIGPLRVLLVACVVVPALLFAAVSWRNYHAAFAEAERDASRTAEVAREHAASVFAGQSLVAERVLDALAGRNDAEIGRDEAALHAHFVRMIAGLPQVQSIIVIDRDGHPLVSTRSYPIDRTMDFSDRDYFVALKAGGTASFISKAQVSRAGGHQLFFGLARRRDGPDGAFAGVIDIAVSPAFFQGFWQSLTGEQGPNAADTVVTLVKADGQILTRYPPFDGPAPRVAPPSPFLEAIARSPQGCSYVSRSVMDRDRPQRHFVYDRIAGYPAYVVVGRSTASILAAWRQTMAAHLVFGIPATIALLLVTWTALRRTRREHAALARARAEMDRRQAAEAAALQAQRMEAVGQLTSGVAHDFNNLLTVVLGNLEIIERAPERADRVRRLAQSGTIAARRGAELTAKLLAFSRRQMTRPEIVDVNALLEDFGSVLRRAATEAVALEVAAGRPLGRALLDPGQLEAAILNLVANARDAMPSGGTIRIETADAVLAPADVAAMPGAAAGRYVRVAVTDTGTGMSPAVAARAFEPFFTTKEVGQGTGLGLSQVYGFCKQAGGYVRIRSEPGRGTAVELFLPRADGALAKAEPRGADALAAAQAEADEVVLVVEDEPGVMEMAVESLTELGYATLTAADGPSALERLRGGERIDILFSDVVMPGGMDGVRLIQEARRLRPGLKVLLASGYSGAANLRELPPDVPFLAKPYRRDDLATKLRVLATAG